MQNRTSVGVYVEGRALFVFVFCFSFFSTNDHKEQIMTWTKTSTRSPKMTAQELILIFLLQFEVVRGQFTYVYARAGDVAILPCNRSSCSGLSWLYSRDQSALVREADNGRVLTTSPRSQRLTLMNDCSLVINRLEADDAGFFSCQQSERLSVDVLLTVMTLTSSSPPDSDAVEEGHVVLKCTLACYASVKCQCGSGKLYWVDDEGQELSPEGIQQSNCLSFFRVLPSGRSRKYTCQYVDKDGVKVQAHYASIIKEVNTKGPGGPPPGSNLLIIIIGAAVAVLMLVIVAVVLVKMKSRRNAAQDSSKHADNNVTYDSVSYNNRKEDSEQKAAPDQTELGVTYATVNVKKKNEDKAKKQVKEEEEVVTYAAVRVAGRSPPDQDVSQ
ncbi:uncharacterized protein LOC133496834 [Syngnathoides biaculeatus]|uniref:uncharacterized protein LOC133496834 n=1 Tax=Syngnathoides biaculeatus TaxID=300417 RepID=UPI002ADD527E|nr:uncharacterized protein LOC133496834 [Syngnathoides biaculeatus]